mgnify:CR=1 FL=1
MEQAKKTEKEIVPQSSEEILDEANATDVVDESPEEDFPQGVAFNTAGTKMFVIGTNSDAVHEYTCVAFDVSSCNVVVGGEKDVSAEEDFEDLSEEEQQELTREFDTNERSSDEVPQEVASETMTNRRSGDDVENRDRLTG